MMEDTYLMEIYQEGFNDYLEGIVKTYTNPLEKKAYETGQAHAWAGDDVFNIDTMTHDEILAEIKE